MTLRSLYTLELETAVTRAVELAARQYARRCTTFVLEQMIEDGKERELHPDAMRMLEIELKTRTEIRRDTDEEYREAANAQAAWMAEAGRYHGTIPPYDVPPADEDPEEHDE